MSHPMRFLVLAGGLAVLAGCTESSGSMQPGEPTLPNFDRSSAPPSSGPHVFRDRFAIVLGGDPSNPLAVMIGFEVTPDQFCAGNGGVPGAPGQVVLTPPGAVLVSESGRDLNVLVFEFGGGPVTDVCQLVGAPIIATGTGKFSAHFGVQDAGATVQGIVDLVSGGQARLFATARVTVRPDGTLLFDEEIVRLTPL